MSENKETKKKVEELEQFDFASDENFNIDEYYDSLTDYQVERENMKQREAEEIIKNKAPQYLNEETIKRLNDRVENLRNLIRRYDVNKEELKQLSNEPGGGRDKIYKIANYLFNKFTQDLNELKMHITFTYDEYDFIYKTIMQKLEYNSDEVFQLIRLRNEALDEYNEMFSHASKGENIKTVMKVSQVVLLYHLLNKYKVKNVNKQFDLFASIMTKIGESNQVFNSYNIVRERLGEDFKQWTTNITEEGNKDKKQDQNPQMKIEKSE